MERALPVPYQKQHGRYLLPGTFVALDYHIKTFKTSMLYF